MRKRLLGMSVSLLCALALAGPVLAEGSFTSYISGAWPGFDSRTWVDKNTDNVVTTIRFDDCRDTVPGTDPNDWVDVTLWKHNWAFPATNRGLNRFHCWDTDTERWGDEPAADYRFEITDYSGPDWYNTISVGWLKVSY